MLWNFKNEMKLKLEVQQIKTSQSQNAFEEIATLNVTCFELNQNSLAEGESRYQFGEDQPSNLPVEDRLISSSPRGRFMYKV